jgi:hypothetical protein
LGSQFCMMDPEEITEEALTREKRRATFIGKEMVV